MSAELVGEYLVASDQKVGVCMRIYLHGPSAY